jgi:hypothetical protein
LHFASVCGSNFFFFFLLNHSQLDITS